MFVQAIAVISKGLVYIVHAQQVCIPAKSVLPPCTAHLHSGLLQNIRLVLSSITEVARAVLTVVFIRPLARVEPELLKTYTQNKTK